MCDLISPVAEALAGQMDRGPCREEESSSRTAPAIEESWGGG